MDTSDTSPLPSGDDTDTQVSAGSQLPPTASQTLSDTASVEVSSAEDEVSGTPSEPGRHVGATSARVLSSSQPPSSSSGGDSSGATCPTEFQSVSPSSGDAVSSVPPHSSTPSKVSPKTGAAEGAVTVTGAVTASPSDPSLTVKTVTVLTPNPVPALKVTTAPSPLPPAAPKPSPTPGVDGGQASKKRSYRQSSTPSADLSDSSPAPGRRSRQQQPKLMTPDSEVQQGDAMDGEVPANLGEGLGDGGVRSSLLDEVLAEKKMSLLHSPEVMEFLQKQQQLVASRQTLEKESGSSRDGNS